MERTKHVIIRGLFPNKSRPGSRMRTLLPAAKVLLIASLSGGHCRQLVIWVFVLLCTFPLPVFYILHTKRWLQCKWHLICFRDLVQRCRATLGACRILCVYASWHEWEFFCDRCTESVVSRCGQKQYVIHQNCPFSCVYFIDTVTEGRAKVHNLQALSHVAYELFIKLKIPETNRHHLTITSHHYRMASRGWNLHEGMSPKHSTHCAANQWICKRRTQMCLNGMHLCQCLFRVLIQSQDKVANMQFFDRALGNVPISHTFHTRARRKASDPSKNLANCPAIPHKAPLGHDFCSCSCPLRAGLGGSGNFGNGCFNVLAHLVCKKLRRLSIQILGSIVCCQHTPHLGCQGSNTTATFHGTSFCSPLVLVSTQHKTGCSDSKQSMPRENRMAALLWRSIFRRNLDSWRGNDTWTCTSAWDRLCNEIQALQEQHPATTHSDQANSSDHLLGAQIPKAMKTHWTPVFQLNPDEVETTKINSTTLCVAK